MPYDTPYNRMIARNQQRTDEEYADYHAYSNQNFLSDGSMGDPRGNIRLFPKMVQREYYTPMDYSGGITHRNMEGDGGPLGRQFNSIALGEDTRRSHNKSAMYAPVNHMGRGSSGGMHRSREDQHYSSSEESCDDSDSDSSDDEEMRGTGVPSHRKLLKHLSKMKLPKDVHQEVCDYLEEMEGSGRGMEGRGGIWDWIKSTASKAGDFIKPLAQVAMPLVKTFTPYGRIAGLVSEGAKALIPGARETLEEYGMGMSGGGVPSHDELMMQLSKMKLPKKQHKAICKYLKDMDGCGRGMEGRGGVWDFIKSSASKVGKFAGPLIKPLAQIAVPLLKEKFPKVAQAIDMAKQFIPGAEEKLAEYGAGVSYLQRPARGDSLTDVRTGGFTFNSKKFLNPYRREAPAKAKAPLPPPVTGQGILDIDLKKYDLMGRKRGGASSGYMMETNENPLIGVPMRKPGYNKSSGLHFEGASLGAGASGGKKRGRPRKVGGSVMGGPSNDPVNRGKITGGRKRGRGEQAEDAELAGIFGDMKLEPAPPAQASARPRANSAPSKLKGQQRSKRKGSPKEEAEIPMADRPIAKRGKKTGSALFKKKGTFPLETKPGEPLTESQIVTNMAVGQGATQSKKSKKSVKLEQAYEEMPPTTDPKTLAKMYASQATVSPAQPKLRASKKQAWETEPVTASLAETGYKPESSYAKLDPARRTSASQSNRPPVPSKGRGKSGGKLKTLLPGSSFSGGKKTSPWIEHVKSYASSHGVSYKQALKEAKATYHK